MMEKTKNVKKEFLMEKIEMRYGTVVFFGRAWDFFFMALMMD